MTEPTRPRASGDDGPAGTGRGSSAGLARWQKVLGLIGLAMVVVLLILLLAGDHGPGRHARSASEEKPTADEVARGPSTLQGLNDQVPE